MVIYSKKWNVVQSQTKLAADPFVILPDVLTLLFFVILRTQQLSSQM